MSKKDTSPPIEANQQSEPKQKHDSTLNIYQRMIEVQKLVTTVDKNSTVKMSENDKGYKATTHDDVAGALHLPLAQCGVFMLPDIVSFKTDQFDKVNQWGKNVTWYRTDLEILVKWINVDKPDDFITAKGASFALDTSDKSFAKAYSLALKIVLLKVHLLESRDGEENRPFDEANGGDKAGKGEPKPKQQETKPKVEPKKETIPVAPKDVIYPFESSVKGKKIGEIDDATLSKAKAWLKEQMDLSPKPKNMSQIAFIYSQVKAVLTDRNPPPPPDDIPENLLNKDPGTHPEDEAQLFPPDDATPHPPGAEDYVIPKVAGFDGISDLHDRPLKKISEGELKAAVKIIDAEMKKTPPKVKIGDLFAIRSAIVTFLKEMDVHV